MATMAVLTKHGILCITLGILLLTGGTLPASGQEPVAGADSLSRTETAVIKAAPDHAASRVFIDPDTGEITPPPAGGITPLTVETLSPETRNALTTSHEGLVATPGSRGGLKLDLRGRFRHAAIATVGSDGKIHGQCSTNAPGGGQ